MDLASLAPYIVGAGGIIAGVYATFQSSKAAKRSLSAEEKARAFTAADEMIENLQEDNAALRAEMRTARQEHADELARLVKEHRVLRSQCRENDERNVAAIQSLQQDNANLRRDLYDMTASLVGLRALVVDEVAREAARDEFGHLDPAEARRIFRELINPTPKTPAPERRLGTRPDATPATGDRRSPEAVDDFEDGGS